MAEIKDVKNDPINTSADEKGVTSYPNEIEETIGGQLHHVDTAIFTEKAPDQHDNALDFLRSTGETSFTYTENEAIKVRWKVDFLIMPLVS